jgi:hypothetical protein
MPHKNFQLLESSRKGNLKHVGWYQSWITFVLIQFCIRSLLYWLRDALTYLCIKRMVHLYTDHFRIVSPVYWLTSTGSPLYWYISVLTLIYIGSPLYWLNPALDHYCIGSPLYCLISIASPLCCPTSVISGLTSDSLLYWLTSVLAHFYFGSPPVLGDFWTGLCLYWFTTLTLRAVLAHVSCT